MLGTGYINYNVRHDEQGRSCYDPDWRIGVVVNSAQSVEFMRSFSLVMRFTALTIIIIPKFFLKRKTGTKILLAGLSDSGKTTMLHQFQLGKAWPTQTSMHEKEVCVTLYDKKVDRWPLCHPSQYLEGYPCPSSCG